MDEQIIPVQAVSWVSILRTAGIMYAILLLAITVIMIITTNVTCSKQNFWASVSLGLYLPIVPIVFYVACSGLPWFRKPFSNVIEMMGISPERSSMFACFYVLLLVLLPVIVYGVHSAEDSACVATADEMTSFKHKMLAELHDKQKAEEKNAQKK